MQQAFNTQVGCNDVMLHDHDFVSFIRYSGRNASCSPALCQQPCIKALNNAMLLQQASDDNTVSDDNTACQPWRAYATIAVDMHCLNRHTLPQVDLCTGHSWCLVCIEAVDLSSAHLDGSSTQETEHTMLINVAHVSDGGACWSYDAYWSQ